MVTFSCQLRNQVARLLNTGSASTLSMDLQDFLAMRVVVISTSSGASNGFRCLYSAVKINRFRYWGPSIDQSNQGSWIRLGSAAQGTTVPFVGNTTLYFESFPVGLSFPVYLDVKVPKTSILGNWFQGGATFGTSTDQFAFELFGGVTGGMLEIDYDAVLNMDDDSTSAITPPANTYRTRTFTVPSGLVAGTLAWLQPVQAATNWDWTDPCITIGT